MDESRYAGPLAEAFSPAGDLALLLTTGERALPVPPSENRTVWDADTGTMNRPAAMAIIKRARAERATPWPQPRASDAVRVYRDGDRDDFEQAVFARVHRLSRAVVAAAVTREDAWVDEVADGVWMLCEQSSWCWPAHDDTFERHGSVLATVTDPYLDLGAGEVVAQLAWVDQVLGLQLDQRYPGLRARIRHEARVRVFAPFTRRRDWHWIGLDGDVHNWNPWIHGNVIAAALRLLDRESERQERADIVALAIEGLDRYVASLPEDGAIDEGYSYWWNGACRALEALDLLTHASGGVLDATGEIEALRETVAFPHRMHLGAGWYLNLADGQAHPPIDQPWHALHRAARSVGDTAASAHAAAHRHTAAIAPESAGLGRLLRGLTEPMWVAAAGDASPLPRDVWLPSTEVLLTREAAGAVAGLTLAIKGGHNGEHHNHNDVGSFVVASDGVPAIVDAGRPTYTAQTFSPERYAIWTMQSTWHNVPEVAGHEQPAGRAYAAREVAVTIDDDASSLALDLASAYDVAGLTRWVRTARLERGPGRVVIDDSWTLESHAASTTVHLLIAGAVALHQGGAVL
ncbi:heparinase II/III family protein, partial [Microbacterium sp.]|uniref:heparinase II/III domain-containing protein n=1 Tax=Microbacterium sp. TaxID=51671 RepID=UPI0027358AD4